MTVSPDFRDNFQHIQYPKDTHNFWAMRAFFKTISFDVLTDPELRTDGHLVEVVVLLSSDAHHLFRGCLGTGCCANTLLFRALFFASSNTCRILQP